MLISVAIPCYNSSKTLPFVVDEIIKTFSDKLDYDYEIVLVNDHSRDNTFQVITELCKNNRKIVGIDLSKNYGQASAQMTAINYVKGDIVVFMDDDGQHPANEIFKLIDKVNEGNDLVYAHFANKKHSGFKRVTSALNSKVLEMTNRKPKGIYTSSYFALSTFVVHELRDYHSPFPSIGGYILQISQNIANVEVEHRARIEGSSNYTFNKLMKLWIQGLTNFSIAPLRLASFIGMLSSAIGILAGIVLIIRKIINPHIAMGYTSLMAAILLIGGLLMMMLGLLGEYIGRIYIVLSNMPQYCVRKVLNYKEEENSDEK